MDALTFICSTHANYRNKILVEFAKIVYAEGMKLLSQAQDMDFVADSFLKFIQIFNSLMCHGGGHGSETSESTLQRLNSAAAILRRPSVTSTVFDVAPGNIQDIETELDMLWETMEQWLSILQNEISQYEEQVYLPTKIYSPENSSVDNGSSSVGSFISSMRRSAKYLRSISKNSLDLEKLRLSQPAYAVNHRDHDSQAYLTRSQSYTNALTDIDDDFEKVLSSESVSPNLQSVSSNLQSVPSSPQTTTVAFDVKLIDLTADRLCAAIHGYHLYCSVKPCWDKR